MIRFESTEYIEDILNEMPMNDLFNMSLKHFGIPKLDSKKSMAGRLNDLASREFNAYLTKIAWPQRLYREPIPYSESYSNPYLVPNVSILMSDDIERKEQKIKNDFIDFYIKGGNRAPKFFEEKS